MNLEQMQQMLDLLNGGFYICLFLALAFLLASALGFWRFDMLTVIKERTGIAARQAAEAFNAENASTTGSLTLSGALDSGPLFGATGTLRQRGRTSDIGRRRLPSRRSGRLSGRLGAGSDNTTRLPSQRAKAENPDAFSSGYSGTTADSSAIDATPAVAGATAVATAAATPAAVPTATVTPAASVAPVAVVAPAATPAVATAIPPAQVSATLTSGQPEPLPTGTDFVLIKEVLVVHTQENLD
jgi:hypothetical protein